MKFETNIFGHPRPFRSDVMERLYALQDGIYKISGHIITVQSSESMEKKRFMLVDKKDGGCSRNFEALAVTVERHADCKLYLSDAMKKAISFWLVKGLEAEEVFTFFESISEKGEISTISLGGI